MSLIVMSPNGDEILGTYEMIPGRAEISTFYRKKDGTLGYNFQGETEMFWDGAETQTKEGKTIFLCSAGKEWTEDQLKVLVEDAEDDEADEANEDLDDC